MHSAISGIHLKYACSRALKGNKAGSIKTCFNFKFPNLRVHGVPGHAVHSPGVAAEDGDGLVPLDVEDVDLVILGTRGYKGLVYTSITAVDQWIMYKPCNVERFSI